MDGNGRWALRRREGRSQGHLAGLEAAKRIVIAASEMGLRYLTLYVFSTENWKRSAAEVGYIMSLVRQYLKAESGLFRQRQIRIRHAGDLSAVPQDTAAAVREACLDTESHGGLQVALALNYGGRDEIVRAVNRVLAAGGPVTEDAISGSLDNPDVPPPDLVIRTAGEYRISNFLLWQSAYAEYYVSGKLWPDFTVEDFIDAIEVYKKRERRFGGVPG
jgi:undecaprenyl diphosphate synthase